MMWDCSLVIVWTFGFFFKHSYSSFEIYLQHNNDNVSQVQRYNHCKCCCYSFVICSNIFHIMWRQQYLETRIYKWRIMGFTWYFNVLPEKSQSVAAIHLLLSYWFSPPTWMPFHRIFPHCNAVFVDTVTVSKILIWWNLLLNWSGRVWMKKIAIYVVCLAVENHIDLPLSRVKMNTSDDDKRQGFSQICYIRSSSNPAHMLFARD